MDTEHGFREAFRTIPDHYHRISLGKLHAATHEILRRGGLSDFHARQCATTISFSDLRGNDTHGFSTLLPRYVNELRTHCINTAPEISVSHLSETCVAVDADKAAGAVALNKGLKLASGLASSSGVGLAFISNARHASALGYFALRAAKQGMFCMVLAAGRGLMVPPRSCQPLLGTNPICFAVPTKGTPTLLFDASTTAACGNRIKLANLREIPLHSNWVREGEQADTPRYASISLPMLAPVGITEDHGAHKAFGLALLAEVLCNAMVMPSRADMNAKTKIGHFVLVVSPQDLNATAHYTSALLGLIEELEPAKGYSRVLYPGLRSHETALYRREHGVPIDPVSEEWLCETLGLPSLDLYEPNSVYELDVSELMG